MKKYVKPLVIAASVAAIAGVGAVSFAAWSGGTTSKDVTGATTGHVDTTGFGIGTTQTLSDKLMPHDQTTIAATGETKMYDIKLVVEGNDVSGYKIQGKYTATKNSTDYTWSTATTGDNAKVAGGISYLIDQNQTATHGTGTWTSWAPSTAAASEADLTITGTLDAGDWYVHVELTSEQEEDMDVVLKFSFSLVSAS